jgi:tetratricopeptide (TPR) repeat protein
VAKSTKSGQRVMSKTIGGTKGKRPEFPIQAVESNAVADKQALTIHYGLLALCVVASVGALTYGGWEIYTGMGTIPWNYVAIVIGVLSLASVFFIARSLLWLSIIAPVMNAAKDKGWKAQEELCNKGLKMARFFPDGSAVTLSMLLVQSLLSRGCVQEAIELGEVQQSLHGDNPKFAETLAPLYTAIGMAQQVSGDLKQSIVWNDRAIDAFGKTMTKFATTKKGWFTKLAESQGQDITGTMQTQLTVAYFNNATSHFNLQNFRQAKANFQKAMETANQAPDFPEKADIVKASREAMTRLKHT